MSLQTALDALRLTIQNTQDFNTAWDAFFDLSMKPGFIEHSHQSRLERLEVAVNTSCKIMLSEPAGVFELPLVVQYADSGFYHGTILSAPRAGSFMYFKDLDIGMIAMVVNATQLTLFCRFRLALVHSSRACDTPSTGSRTPTVH